ncbi:sugar phosphate nucleotidyltransferase [Methylobacter svalbardensis]|uniref:sugar phosphate nucleotidyltransferase n=1 Tax=Methylobacter svalbardensis TaxID=3080016 RepID=UPI0030EC9157
MLDKTLAIILAGGMGLRLYPLTADRAKPTVPFGGNYRIIDFTLTNCLHSGLRRVLVLTQYKSHSLQNICAMAGPSSTRKFPTSQVQVDENAVVEDSILYDRAHVAASAHLKRCIVDKNVQIPPGEQIGFDSAADAVRSTVPESGITIVLKGYRFLTNISHSPE